MGLYISPKPKHPPTTRPFIFLFVPSSRPLALTLRSLCYCLFHLIPNIVIPPTYPPTQTRDPNLGGSTLATTNSLLLTRLKNVSYESIFSAKVDFV